MSIALTLRSRSTVVATAVAASVLCGSMMSASASVSTGDRSVYVPITPCRVMDTRPAPVGVGARSTPLTGNETYTIAVLGSNGQCSVPVDASAVAMNVTVVNPTGASFLTVFPADAAQPLASSLNWVAGQGATPNAVVSDVSADGKVSFFNNSGSVDVIADVVGYFVDHNHDDRYYTKTEIEAKLATKVDKTTGQPGTIAVGPAAFAPGSNPAGISYTVDPTGSITVSGGPLCFQAAVSLPNGATVTALRLDGFDNVAANLSVTMNADPFGSTVAIVMASAASSGATGVVTVADVTITAPVVDNTARAYSLRVCTDAGLFFYDARIDYIAP